MSLDGLNGIALNQLRLSTALAMSLQNVDRLDVVLRSKNSFLLDGFNAVNHKSCEKFRVSVDQFARHGGLGSVEKGLLTEALHSDC